MGKKNKKNKEVWIVYKKYPHDTRVDIECIFDNEESATKFVRDSWEQDRMDIRDYSSINMDISRDMPSSTWQKYNVNE